MEKIAHFCESQLNKHQVTRFDRLGKQDAWRTRVVNKKGVIAIINYFDKYSLFSSKYLNYLDWKEAYVTLIQNKEHIGINKLNTYEKIKLIKERMNQKRKIFNWEHLENFYIK